MASFGNGASNSNYDLVFASAKYSLDELSDRFYDINLSVMAKVRCSGFVKEIGSYAPFHGLINVKTIINLLNKDIDIEMSDSDTIKIRNSIVFYNEYFVPSPENKYGSLPAQLAFENIEEKYNIVIGKKEEDYIDRNPFLNDVLEGIVFGENDDNVESKNDFNPDNAMKDYIENKRKLDSKIASSKYFVNKNTSHSNIVPRIRVPKHNMICSKLPSIVDLDNFEKCFDNIDFELD